MTTTVGSVVRSGTRPVDGLEARTVNADASWADAATADDRALDRFLPVRRPSPQNKFYRRHALGRRHGRLEPVHSLENRFATPIEAKAPRDTSRIGGSARPRNLRMFSQQQVVLSAEAPRSMRSTRSRRSQSASIDVTGRGPRAVAFETDPRPRFGRATGRYHHRLQVVDGGCLAWRVHAGGGGDRCEEVRRPRRNSE